MDVTELAWMAGIIDLKGRIRSYHQAGRRTPQLSIMVETKHWLVIDKLCKMTGIQHENYEGQKIRDSTRRNCMEHCPEPHVHVVYMPAMYRWKVAGVSAAVVVFNLLPYLISDVGYYEFITEIFANTPKEGHGVGAVAKAIKRLEDLGWAIPVEFGNIPTNNLEKV